jgi:hypothetical protein
MTCEAKHGHLLYLTQLRESLQRSLDYKVTRLVTDASLVGHRRGHIEAAVIAGSNELETLDKQIAKLTTPPP